MNLIANTGIQLFSFPLNIDLNNNFKMFFHEWIDGEAFEKKMEIAHFFPNEDKWIKKNLLYGRKLGYATLTNNYKVTVSWEEISNDPDFDDSAIINIDTEEAKESGCFDISIGKISEADWAKFENTWFPMPFFERKGKKSVFGPTNWCRFKLIPNGKNKQERRYHLLLAFDTKTVFKEEGFEEYDLQETPVFSSLADNSKEYSLCNTEEGLIQYCSDYYSSWVDKYLLKHFLGIDDINDRKLQMPKLKYLAQYIFLNRFIYLFGELPSITLFSAQNIAYGSVDLVVDIGNSRTCAVLYDDSDFTKASPLELQNFTEPVTEMGKLNKHKDSFDMRLAFREADFGGKFGIENSRQFIYPSMIRLGVEANHLIYKATNMNTGAEKISTFSSPKRFLWDETPQKLEWEFVKLANEKAKPIYIEGVSEQLNEDGTLGKGSIKNKYSRKALMTFAFLEILAQAKMQINSYEQRNHWGNESMPRRIGRIIVTCPTAMSHIEQIALRKCAQDAAIMIERFTDDTYLETPDLKTLKQRVKVIPSADKLAYTEERTEWIYDEATAAQFVFLYAEIKERYQKNVKDYFDFYGKYRDDISDYKKKTLTIGSVDIGAGTTDLMIATYKYDDSNAQCVLTPIPLFWESFYIAGDDLMKKLVQQLVIEGEHSPITQKLNSMGINPIDVLQPFLGTDTGVSAEKRRLRSDFNLQVSMPIVSRYLELLKEDRNNITLSFDDIFLNNTPTDRVMSYFESCFGFNLKVLKWNYDKEVISSIIVKNFDSLIGKISSLLSFYSCDIVLLSGRPTSLRPITDLFLKYYPVSPNRIKSMNDYRVGRWYPEDKRCPYIDGNGKFINPKSIITTGAMIGEIAQKGGLNGFTLNLSELKKKLLPTTYYFGKLNEDSLAYLETIISPDNNISTLKVSSLPIRIGVRQLDIESYPSRPFYTLDYNDAKIEDRVLGRLTDEQQHNQNIIAQAVQKEKDKIQHSMPISIRISRELNQDMEKIVIDDILDKDGNSLNRNFFKLQVQSMSELNNFWLDSGIFSLNINH